MAKSVTIQELRSKSEDQLVEGLRDLKKEAFNLRFQQSTGELRNTARVRQVRREVARIQTALSEKAKGIVVETAAKPVKKAKPAAAPKVAKEKAAPKAKATTAKAKTVKKG